MEAVFKFKKRDGIFLGLLLVLAVAALLIFFFYDKENGDYVEITVQGESYGTFLLSEEAEIPIYIDGVCTNTLVISQGCAKMEEADCPDQICVNHVAVSQAGETIVCLPNKIVVTVYASKK